MVAEEHTQCNYLGVQLQRVTSGALGGRSPKKEVIDCQLFAKRVQGPVAQPGEQTLRDTVGANDPRLSHD